MSEFMSMCESVWMSVIVCISVSLDGRGERWKETTECLSGRRNRDISLSVMHMTFILLS